MTRYVPPMSKKTPGPVIKVNDINEINDGLINLCKLGPGLMRINDGLMWINGTLTFCH